jgi:hypothetical protein
MGKRPILVTLILVLLSLIAGISGCNTNAESPSNTRFSVRVSGEAGAMFAGYCTHETHYPTGSRTETSDIQGTIDADGTTLEFTLYGIEISGKIEPKIPEKPITITALQNDTVIYHAENTSFDTYFSWYHP